MNQELQQLDRIPVTIVGGYLGAGKTTLINHLLRNANGKRLAILVNEFGKLPIDGDLIESIEGEVINVVGGCICCSYGESMISGLMDLTDIKPSLDYVVIEASGVAIPGSIATTVQLLDGFSLNGIITIADCDTLLDFVEDPYLSDTIKTQFAHSDITIVNKIDLANEETHTTVIDWLSQNYPTTQLIETCRTIVPPEIVLDLSNDSGQSEFFESNASHASVFASTSVQLENAMDIELLAEALASQALGLIRVKGFMKSGDGTIKSLQTVGRRWEIKPVQKQVPCHMVLIGMKSNWNPQSLQSLIAKFAVDA